MISRGSGPVLLKPLYFGIFPGGGGGGSGPPVPKPPPLDPCMWTCIFSVLNNRSKYMYSTGYKQHITDAFISLS